MIPGTDRRKGFGSADTSLFTTDQCLLHELESLASVCSCIINNRCVDQRDVERAQRFILKSCHAATLPPIGWLSLDISHGQQLQHLHGFCWLKTTWKAVIGFENSSIGIDFILFEVYWSHWKKMTDARRLVFRFTHTLFYLLSPSTRKATRHLTRHVCSVRLQGDRPPWILFPLFGVPPRSFSTLPYSHLRWCCELWKTTRPFCSRFWDIGCEQGVFRSSNITFFLLKRLLCLMHQAPRSQRFWLLLSMARAMPSEPSFQAEFVFPFFQSAYSHIKENTNVSRY